jgi:methylthioribulose-1-phosphate dehydratase
MIKGVRIGGIGRALSYLDTLEVPIIENTPNEEDLKDSMAEAMVKHPNTAGVLVRRHGVYVWGQLCNSSTLFTIHYTHLLGADWEKAKTQTEVSSILNFQELISIQWIYRQCLDYLFEIGVKMKLAGLPTVVNEA